MSERDKDNYWKIRTDPVKYAAYRERKTREQRVRAAEGRIKNEAERKRKWRAANKEKAAMMRKAGHRVETALRNGSLIRPSVCSKCGAETKVEAHHYLGYEEQHWLDIVWLCVMCHRKADGLGLPSRAHNGIRRW